MTNLLQRKTGGLFGGKIKKEYAYVGIIPNGFNGEVIYQLLKISKTKYKDKKQFNNITNKIFTSKFDAKNQLKNFDIIFYKMLPIKIIGKKIIKNMYQIEY